MKECFNEARPPLKKKGGGNKWGALKKNRSHVHTLSLPPPKTGGEREKEREKRATEKKRTHTHTHTLAHTSVPVKPEWRGEKEAGR